MKCRVCKGVVYKGRCVKCGKPAPGGYPDPPRVGGRGWQLPPETELPDPVPEDEPELEND